MEGYPLKVVTWQDLANWQSGVCEGLSGYVYALPEYVARKLHKMKGVWSVFLDRSWRADWKGMEIPCDWEKSDPEDWVIRGDDAEEA